MKQYLIFFLAIAFASNAVSYESDFYFSDRYHSRASLRHIEGGGIGYKHGYTTLESFLAPDPESVRVMPFLDLRGHVFDDGKMAANVGAGLRKIAGCRAYGINGYYDYRKVKKTHYNQMGLGFEMLGRRWDFRVNGYMPFGNQTSCPCPAQFVGFSGNHMIVSQKYDFALTGFNTELGLHLGRYRSVDFYAAAGAYHYSGAFDTKFWGGQGRLTCRFKDYFSIELSDSYDKEFRNRFQCQISIILPFGGKSHDKQIDDSNYCSMPETLLSRMVQPVEREEIIVQAHTKKCCPAIDPATGDPYYFVFVDNTSHSLGTYESPYPTLALAQANSGVGDIIYVLPGDGTTKGMDEGITLQFNQKLWGSGLDYAVQTAQGDFIIPARSSTAPKITNINGNGIILASTNQVRGIIITDAVDSGIFGTNLQDIDIAECTIDNSVSDQIHLEYSGSSGVANLNNLILVNGQQKGIFIGSTSTFMECTVNGCTMEENADSTIDSVFADQTLFKLTNNLIQRNNNSNVFNFSGPGTLFVSDNSFNANTSINNAPLLIIADHAPVTATITKNNISNNTCSAVHLVLNDSDSAEMTVSRNTIANNGSGSIGVGFGSAIFIDASSSSLSNCLLNVTDTVFTNNSASSIYCANGDFNDFELNVTDNTMANNGGSGLVFASGSSAFKLAATNNTISDGHDHGIAIIGSSPIVSADMTIANNTITGNTGSASAIALSHTGVDLNFVVTNNDLSNNEGSAIIMYSSVGVVENVVVDIESNTVANNQNLSSNQTGGIDLEQYTNLSGSIANNTFTNNSGPGLYIGSTDTSPSVCIEMTGNSSDTDYTLSAGTGTFNLAPCDVNTVNTGTITTAGTVTIVQSCPSAIPCPP